MGTKVQSKSYLPGYHSMRDLNDSNSLNWPFHCGDKTLPNAQYCNGFLPRSVVGAYPEYDKDAVKQTMLEHEAIFKNQVYELHRLYRIQRNLMDEIKRKALDRNQIIPLDTSLPSSPQNTSEDGQRLSIPGLPLSSSVYARLSISGSCSKSKDAEAMESRPTKVRKKMFNLELPASEYADTEEGELFGNENHEDSDRLFLGDVGKSGCEGNASRLRSSNGLADLNEPIHAEETNPPAYISLLGISCHGNSNGAMKNLRAEGNDNGIVRFHHVLEAGQDKVHGLPTFHNDQSKIGLWRERTTSGLNNSERLCDFSSFNHQDSFMASHMPGLYPVAPSSEKPNSLHQRPVAPFQPHPSLNSLSKNSQSPVLGNAWYLTSSSKANPGYVRELPNQNGSSSVSKDLQAPVSSINHNYFKGVNLNAAFSQQGFRGVDGERKQDDQFTGLPWLGSNKNVVIDSRDPQKEPSFVPSSMNQHFPYDVQAGNVELGDGAETRRILGLPVFEELKVPESSRTASLSLSRLSETCSTSKLLDINLPCDDAASPDLNREVLEEGMFMEKGAGKEVSGLRRYIDLNSCLSEDEEVSPIPFAQNNNSLEETRVHGAPEELETERELAKTAAQAIVDISLFVDESDLDLDLDLLCWFSEIASSMNDRDSSSSEEEEEVDYFESMTLQLSETTPEELLPVSDRLLEEQATIERFPAARGGGARRGRAGRGRQQRRDFQRDILPGLTSLSWHEVTEDLQALGGGMGRATGRSWQPGPARKNSGRKGGRGRRARRDVVSISPPPIVAAIPALTRQVSIASVTGWGKTTRRPRRQRCHPGNLKPLPLT